MPEHLIRLRGAWEHHDPAGPRRLDLPTVWPPGLASPLTLTRRFRQPPLGPAETISLRLEAVPGLNSARINGVELAGPDAGTSSLEIPLQGLTATNLLSLKVDPARVGTEPWGAIALVIRPG